MPTKEEWGGDTEDWAADAGAAVAVAAPPVAAVIAAPAATFQVTFFTGSYFTWFLKGQFLELWFYRKPTIVNYVFP